MSGVPGAPPRVIEITGRREEVLNDLRTARQELARKLEKGRVRDSENEKVRVKWARALAYVSNVELDGLNEAQLDELKSDVEALKADGVEA